MVEGDETGNRPQGIDNQGKVRLPGAKVRQQLHGGQILGNGWQRPRQTQQIERALAIEQDRQQILHMHQAAHMLTIASAEGIAGVAVAQQGAAYLGAIVAFHETNHIRRWSRQIASTQLVKIESTFENVAGAAAQGAMALAECQDHLQFIAARRALAGFTPSTEAHDPQHQLGNAIEEDDGGIEKPVKDVQRQRRPQGNLLGFAYCQRLGGEFAKDDGSKGHQHKGYSKRRRLLYLGLQAPQPKKRA